MEETVALDTSKQKQFVKSIQGIKKLIKKNDTEGVTERILKAKAKDGVILKRKRKPRGLVYLGHVPHGFYEHEMSQYFKQFGVVTNVRVIRSKNTGRSKGYAFVEFKDTAVAEIVADTMNNYLMGKRLIKASYIPPEKQKRFALRKHWSAVHNPMKDIRIQARKVYNATVDEQGELKKARKLLASFRKNKKRINDLGINYDFFTPVDVPEALSEPLPKPVIKKENADANNDSNVGSTKSKKNGKTVQAKAEKQSLTKNKKVEGNTQQKVKKDTENNKEVQKKLKQKTDKAFDTKKNLKKESEKVSDTKKSLKKETEKVPDTKKKLKKVTEIAVDVPPKNKKQKNEREPTETPQQKLKDKKLNDAGVKHVENFIKIKEDSDGDSDSAYEFDSDEFDKLLEKESDSDEGSGDDESDNEDLDISEEEVAPQKMKSTKKAAPTTTNKQESLLQTKRKASQKPPVPPKKSKFENRNTQKLVKKQFKKRK